MAMYFHMIKKHAGLKIKIQKLTCKSRDLMLYDFYLEKQVLLDKFDMILKKLYKMPEAELSVDEGAIYVLFSPFPSIRIVSF